jgi:hypothetical protein
MYFALHSDLFLREGLLTKTNFYLHFDRLKFYQGLFSLRKGG